MSDDANTLIQEQQRLYGEQSNWRNLWNECGRYVMPGWDSFDQQFTEGSKRTQFLFDGTAVTANERFSAVMSQLVTPATQQYQKLVPIDEELRDNKEVSEHYEQVTKILFAARYRARAAFSSNMDECYMSLGAFGNMALFIDEELGIGIRYRAIPLMELCWTVDHQGQVDTVYRLWEYTAKAALQRFKDKTPPSVLQAMEKDPFQKFEFIHCVKPNDHIKGQIGPDSMRFKSWIIACKEKSVIESGGFRTFPYGIGRYRMAPREPYGRGPTIAALPAIRTLNEQKKSAMRVSQLQGEPAILVAEEGLVNPFNQRPGAMNYGMLSSDGKPLAQPFNQGGNVPLTMEMMQLERTDINDAFLTSLFQILVQNPQMTATEALIRLQEKGVMTAPAGLRLQGEFLGSVTERELDILQQARQLPPPPEEVIRAGGYKIDYHGPINKMLRAEEAVSIMSTVQDVAVMAQIQPSVVHTLDWDAMAREIAEIRGMSAKFVLDEEDVYAMREDMDQQAQAQQVAAAAPGLSQSALNLAKAQQVAAA
jgi:hypothetical protein